MLHLPSMSTWCIGSIQILIPDAYGSFSFEFRSSLKYARLWNLKPPKPTLWPVLFFWVSGSLTAATPPVQPCYRLCYFNHYPEFAGSQPDFTSFITGPQPTENHLINTLLRAPLNISVPMPIYCIGPKIPTQIEPTINLSNATGKKKKKITRPYRLMRLQNLWYPISAEALTLLSNVSPIIFSPGPPSHYSR